MKTIGIIFCTLLLLAPISCLAAHTPNSTRDGPDWWPMYGHDLRHTGFSSSSAPETSTLLFSSQVMTVPPHAVVNTYSGPVFVDGKLYFASGGSYNNLFCIDGFTGGLLWSKDLIGGVECSPTIADGKVYQFNYPTLYCLNGENGSTLWTFPIPDDDSVYSSAAVSDGKIYFGSDFDQKFYCVNTDGTQAWSADADVGFSAHEASPAVFDGKVYVAASPEGHGPTYVYCYNATDGTLIWTYYTSNGPGKTPTIINGDVYIGIGNKMFCLDAEGNGDGTTDVVWSFLITGTGSVTSSASAYGNIYFGTTNSRVYCLNGTTGNEVWNRITIGAPTTPALADNKVYVVTTSGDYPTYDNHMYCLDAIGNGNGTTNVIWQYTLPEHDVLARAQPAISKSVLWVVTDYNWVYAFSDNHAPTRPAPPTGPTQGYTGVEYTFSATTTDPDNDNLSYRWDWNDGTYTDWSDYVPSGASVTASHTWDAPGNYFIKAQAHDEIGFTTTWSIGHMITIQPYQTMTVDAHGPYSELVGEMIQFTGNVTGGAPPYNWSWDFGNGDTADVQNPAYAYPAAGVFTVTVTVTDASGNNVNDTTTATITPGTAPVLAIGTITGGFFTVSAEIKNSGDANATNVSWAITVTGGILGKINVSAEGTVDSLAPNATEIGVAKPIFGLGKIHVVVTATCDEGVSVTKDVDGKILIFWVSI